MQFQAPQISGCISLFYGQVDKQDQIHFPTITCDFWLFVMADMLDQGIYLGLEKNKNKALGSRASSYQEPTPLCPLNGLNVNASPQICVEILIHNMVEI